MELRKIDELTGTVSEDERSVRRIERYRAAARGEFDIHTISADGFVVYEFFASVGERPDEDIDDYKRRVDWIAEDPNSVTYDGALSLQRCAEIADQLELE